MSKEIILWSKATVFLSTLKFETTDNLNVSFADKIPEGTLVSLDEVRYEDIKKVEPFNNFTSNSAVGYVGGVPGVMTTVRRRWQLTSTGSGNLTVTAKFDWEFDSVPWAKPDGIAGSPDNVLITIHINDLVEVCHFQYNALSNLGKPILFLDKLLDVVSSVFFNVGQIQSLTVSIGTDANGGWVNMPTAPLAPPNISVHLNNK